VFLTSLEETPLIEEQIEKDKIKEAFNFKKILY